MNVLKPRSSKGPIALVASPGKLTFQVSCPCLLRMLTVQIWKEFPIGFIFHTLSPHTGYYAASSSGFRDN